MTWLCAQHRFLSLESQIPIRGCLVFVSCTLLSGRARCDRCGTLLCSTDCVRQCPSARFCAALPRSPTLFFRGITAFSLASASAQGYHYSYNYCVCARIRLYMCPHTSFHLPRRLPKVLLHYVSAYVCVRILVYVSSCCYIFPYASIQTHTYTHQYKGCFHATSTSMNC
jgi:hypothetical protein